MHGLSPFIRKFDSCIMDHFAQLKVKLHDLYHLNRCKIYLHIIIVADITLVYGTHIAN